MMSKVEFEIEKTAYNQMFETLKEYGDYEVGGMIIGYRKGKNQFVISDFTIADETKTFGLASFVREPAKSLRKLNEAFKRKKHNYLGEWHSHPRFRLYPSRGDFSTMKRIISDPDYGVDFSLLIISKLKNGKLEIAGFLFHRRIESFIEASINYNGEEMLKPKKRIDTLY
jgi:integrative and conjugative element protein (TIGR02256 family)